MSLRQFEILDKLGSGAFSNVFRVRRLADRQVYAMKQIKFSKLNQKARENALNEIRLLASLSHPNIIAYKEAFFAEDQSTLCIVMEHAEGGDLFSKIREARRRRERLPESFIWRVLVQTLHGLQLLHKMTI